MAKGEVCKTFMQRFKSARRLHTPSFLALVLVVILIVPSLAIAANEDGIRVFRDALQRYRSGDYASAAEKFTSARSSLPVLGDFALYFRAKALDGLKSYGMAEDALNEMARAYPDSPARREALLIQVLKDSGQDARLLAELDKYTAQHPADADAEFLLATVLKRSGDTGRARKLFKDIYIRAGRNAKAAALEIDTSALSADDLLTRSANLIDAMEYAEAEATIKKAMQMSLPPAISNAATEKLAYCLFRQKRYAEAGPVCEGVGQGYLAARSYLRAGKIAKFEAVMQALVAAREPKAGELLIAMGEEKRREGHAAEALGIFVKVSDVSASLREEAVWRMGWTLYAVGNYNSAASVFSSLYDTYKSPRYLYWEGRATERAGKGAGHIYAKIDDNGFYGLMAHVYKKAPAPPPPVQSAAPCITPDERIDALVAVGLGEEAGRELLARAETAHDDRRVTEAAYRLKDLGRYHDALAAIYRIKDEPRPDDILYPMAYWPVISDAALHNGIDPFLVLSVIREESRYDPEAYSPAGAIGLMQLMPQTAHRMASSLNIKGVSDRVSIMDADNNIRMGVHYLATLIREFNSVPRALAAYNAGADKVHSWMDHAKRLRDPDEFIEDIPYQETRDYVKRILSSYYHYRIYPQYIGTLGSL